MTHVGFAKSCNENIIEISHLKKSFDSTGKQIRIFEEVTALKTSKPGKDDEHCFQDGDEVDMDVSILKREEISRRNSNNTVLAAQNIFCLMN